MPELSCLPPLVSPRSPQWLLILLGFSFGTGDVASAGAFRRCHPFLPQPQRFAGFCLSVPQTDDYRVLVNTEITQEKTAIVRYLSTLVTLGTERLRTRFKSLSRDKTTCNTTAKLSKEPTKVLKEENVTRKKRKPAERDFKHWIDRDSHNEGTLRKRVEDLTTSRKGF